MEPLLEIVELLEKQADATARAYYAHCEAKVQRDHDLQLLIQTMQGKSQAEKVSLAQGTAKWIEINRVFNKLDARYDLEKRKYEVLKFEYQAVYLNQKQDNDGIKRQGV